MVSEPAGIPALRSKRHAQQDTRAYDDQITDCGREQARDQDETKPDQPGKDQPLPLGSVSAAVTARVQSAAEASSA
jgi:hypothetical protein